MWFFHLECELTEFRTTTCEHKILWCEADGPDAPQPRPMAALDVADGTIMDQFVAWFEREAVDDQVEHFIIRNAQRLSLTDDEIAGGIDGEQNHAWWPVYEEYKETFERLLQSFLDESGVSSHQFAEAARHATGMAETYLIVINALSDYTMFVEMVTEEEAKQRRSIVGADGRVRDPAEEVMEMERMRQGKQQQPVWGGGEDDPDWVPTDHAPDHAPGAAEADAG